MVGLAERFRGVLATLDPANFKHKRWRDKKNVVHNLEAHKMGGLASGVSWVSVCGKHEPSLRKCVDDATPVTCLQCLAGAQAVHDDDCILYCPNHGTGRKCRTLHHCNLCAERA